MLDALALLLACLRHHPVRTLEQPIEYHAPIGVWSW